MWRETNQFTKFNFMKTKILEALKAKFVGGNANILDRIATMLAKTVTSEDQVATAVEGVTQDYIDVITAFGDSRATEAQKTAVQNYEKKYGLKDGAKVEDKPKDGGTKQNDDDDTPAWAKALIDSNKQLTDRLNQLEGDRTAASRKQKLDEVLGKLPENLRKAYSRTPLDGTDDEWNSRLTEVTGEVNDLAASLKVKGAVFGRPFKGTTERRDGELTEAQEKAIAQRNGVPAEDQQPF